MQLGKVVDVIEVAGREVEIPTDLGDRPRPVIDDGPVGDEVEIVARRDGLAADETASS